jgi:hypothetical protein
MSGPTISTGSPSADSRRQRAHRQSALRRYRYRRDAAAQRCRRARSSTPPRSTASSSPATRRRRPAIGGMSIRCRCRGAISPAPGRCSRRPGASGCASKLTVPNSTTDLQSAQVLQSMVAEAGIDLDLVATEVTTALAQWSLRAGGEDLPRRAALYLSLASRPDLRRQSAPGGLPPGAGRDDPARRADGARLSRRPAFSAHPPPGAPCSRAPRTRS